MRIADMKLAETGGVVNGPCQSDATLANGGVKKCVSATCPLNKVVIVHDTASRGS
jgi:hypothetical protein